MINLGTRRCLLCLKVPNFNFPGEKRALYCVTHRLDGMVDVMHKMCQTCGTTRATCNLPGLATPLYCDAHKLPLMVSVVNNGITCQFPACPNRANYNYRSESRGMYCEQHILPDMVDVLHPKCIVCCEKRPTYNLEGLPALYCGKCKTSDMVDVLNKRCITCNKDRAYFNMPDLKPEYCKQCKTLAMINVTLKYCEHPDCASKPVYGLPGKSPVRCNDHKVDGDMKNSNKRCSQCKALAIWGTCGKPQACEAHKTDDMQNLVEHPCHSCQLLYVLDAQNLCENCNPETAARVRLSKQRAASAYMKENGLVWVSEDRQLEDASVCEYRKRPDFLFDGVDRFVVVEVDEHQHRSRPCDCEQVRMVNIAHVLHLPTIFIRFNPDAYKPGDRHCEAAMHIRHKELVQKVEYWMQADLSVLGADRCCGAVYLYFDGDTHAERQKLHILA